MTARTHCRYCPKRADADCGCCCFECSELAPSPPRWFPTVRAGLALTFAGLVMAACLLWLVAALDARFDVQPSPAGPTVVEVSEP